MHNDDEDNNVKCIYNVDDTLSSSSEDDNEDVIRIIVTMMAMRM